MGIEIQGLDELISKIEDMTIDAADERRALRAGAKVVAEKLSADSPVLSGRMADIKTTISTSGDGIASARIRAGAYWSVFNEYGTSKFKSNIGYFKKSVDSSAQEAVQIMADEILKNKL